jgi:DNA-binding transcriptional LysR family regulator
LVPALRSNSVHLVQEFARRAMGVAYLPTMIAYHDLLEGRLTRVLPDYETEIPFFSAVYPTSHRATAKVKLFLDLLSSTFSMEPEWDRLLGLTQEKST